MLIYTNWEKENLEIITPKYITSSWLYYFIIDLEQLKKYFIYENINFIINKNDELEQIEFLDKNEINFELLFNILTKFLKLQKNIGIIF